MAVSRYSYTTYILLGIIITLIIISLVLIYVPSADDFSPDNPFYNGLSIYVSDLNVSRISLRDLGSIDPRSSVIFIVGPSKNFSEEEISLINDFLMRGGVVFVADDFGSAQDLLSKLGVGVLFYKGVLRDPLFMYRNSYLPRTKIFFGDREYIIYMNYGSALEISGSIKGSCLGNSSIFSFIEIYDYNSSKKIDGPFCIFYNVSHGGGVLYVFSDASIFINSMIHLGDNERFARDIIGFRRPYLVTDKWFVGRYTEIRSFLIDSLSFLIYSSYRYVLASILVLFIYALSIKYYPSLMRRGSSSADRDINKFINDLINKHVDWDKDTLRRLADEVLGGEERGE